MFEVKLVYMNYVCVLHPVTIICTVTCFSLQN